MDRSSSAPLLIQNDLDDDYSTFNDCQRDISNSWESLPEFMQKLMAEFIGTYLFLFAGFAAIAVSKEPNSTALPFQGLGPAIVWGLDIMVLTYIVGPISGAHFNPAVTVAFAIFNKFPWKRVVPYIFVQVLASVLASRTIQAIYGKNQDLLLRTVPSGSHVQSLAMEFVITFYLLFSVCGATIPAIKELTGLAAGSAIMINTFIAGSVSGASMNPARSLGPAIAFNSYRGIWVYIVGPILGGIAGSWFYSAVTFTKHIRPRRLGK